MGYNNAMAIPGSRQARPDPRGNINPMAQTFDESEGVYRQPAQYSDEELAGRRRAEMMQMMGREDSTSTQGVPANLPRIAYPDTTAADAATFARGKDQAAQTGRASINAMQEELAGRGMLGGGVEANMTGQKVQQVAGHVNEITREQSIQHAESARQRAQQEYEGQITQRGQDISNANALAQRRQQRLQMIMSLY